MCAQLRALGDGAAGAGSPQLIVDKMGPQNRVGRIFVDYLRNQKGASTVAAYSVRARPGSSVAAGEPGRGAPPGSADQWRLGNVRDYLSARSGDPWADYSNTRQRLGRELLERLREDRWRPFVPVAAPILTGRQRIPTTLYPGGRAARHPV